MYHKYQGQQGFSYTSISFIWSYMQVTNKHFSDDKRSTVIFVNRVCTNVRLTICAQMFQTSAQILHRNIRCPIYRSTVCEQTDSKRSTKIFVNCFTSVMFCFCRRLIVFLDNNQEHAEYSLKTRTEALNHGFVADNCTPLSSTITYWSVTA